MISVGHATDVDGATGCTVVSHVDAFVLCGGSAFGLDAASGVVAWLREQRRGATVGKWAGREHAVKGGIGIASRVQDDLAVTAVVANNAAGDILDESGRVLAGSRASSVPRSPSTTAM